jgi:hypothetical protein
MAIVVSVLSQPTMILSVLTSLTVRKLTTILEL